MKESVTNKFRLSSEGWWLANPMIIPNTPPSKRTAWERWWANQASAQLVIKDFLCPNVVTKRDCVLIIVGGRECWADIVTGALYDARSLVGLTSPSRTIKKPRGTYSAARFGPSSVVAA